MSPLWQQALGSIIRWVLTLASGYLVSKGVWSLDKANVYVEAATLGSLSLVWSLYQKWQAHQLHMPVWIAYHSNIPPPGPKPSIIAGSTPAEPLL